MSSINNVNNNNYVVNVGRTVPLTPGPQGADKSLPVVVSTDQTAIPVVEQNKIQSEVALSLLGIPRSEVALGIFADVNTYDVNPGEWSYSPSSHALLAASSRTSYTSVPGVQGWGIKHLPEESGALVEAPADETAVLTSKRFFRYQPGRVSSATFGVKNSIFPGNVTSEVPDNPTRNPPIRKYGIFDKFDGYYWEVRDRGQGDQFSVVRRTQSITRYNPLVFGNSVGQQVDDHALAGKPPATVPTEVNFYPTAVKYLEDNRFTIISAAIANVDPAYAAYLSSNSDKCERDLDFAIDAYINDLKWGGDAHSIVNATTYRTALLANKPAEQDVHTKLGEQIYAVLDDIDNEAASKIYTTGGGISQYMINAVGGIQPDLSDISNADYGSRNKIETIFSIYDKYLAYLVSESIAYTGSNTDLIKYKCLRDVKFVINGYANDLQFGGNASTIYNAKRYYFLANDRERNLQVYTQDAEVDRHKYLLWLLTGQQPGPLSLFTGPQPTFSLSGYTDVCTLFSLDDAQKTALTNLATIIIKNFDEEYTGAINFGNGAVHGDLVIFRDGLIMTHASVYDPTLLKPRIKTVAKVNTTDDTLTLGKGDLRIGQYVNYYGDAGGLIDGKMYLVKTVNGTKSNIITLADPSTPTDEVVITTAGTTNQIEVPVPFIFPNEYENATNGPANSEFRKDGMFPYLYSETGVLPQPTSDNSVGYIDTAINVNNTPDALKKQIDTLNLAYINWVRDHVDPQYYSVYEYRIPRSRFSGDSLDAGTRTAVYSDNVAGNRAGSVYTENDTAVTQTSVWDLDFTKVTMLKIEFSWYGAVGALFLAYVPVGNGEARWVRVHHLRASNQLKIASLGNATLPITYLVYGGGSESRLGIANELRENRNYDNSFSEYIVKYGASYYIDGGDRGTVRLYNHSSDTPTEVYGSKYMLNVNASNADTINNPYYTVNSVPSGAPSISTFYIGAKVITGSPSDRGVEVIWAEGDNLYLNKPVSSNSSSSISVVVDRPAIIFGLEAKENIVSGDGVEVRNRVQVYPTKLSVGSTGSASSKLTMLKTPLFQNLDVTTSGSFVTSADVDLSETNLIPTASNYLPNNGDYVYGYFKGYLDDSESFIKVLGKLEKTDENYYFYPEEVFTGTLTIESNSTFLKEGVFDSEGNDITSDSTSISKERLSSVKISSIARSPIPGTGTRVTTYHISAGSHDFDLLSYFDYNKEYISYPLTDQVETLYLVSYSTQTNSESSLASVLASLTWEEQ